MLISSQPFCQHATSTHFNLVRPLVLCHQTEIWNDLCNFWVLHISGSFIYHCFTHRAHEKGFLQSNKSGTIVLANSHLTPSAITYSSSKSQLKLSVDCMSSLIAFHHVHIIEVKLCTLTVDSCLNSHLRKYLGIIKVSWGHPLGCFICLKFVPKLSHTYYVKCMHTQDKNPPPPPCL